MKENGLCFLIWNVRICTRYGTSTTTLVQERKKKKHEEWKFLFCIFSPSFGSTLMGKNGGFLVPFWAHNMVGRIPPLPLCTHTHGLGPSSTPHMSECVRKLKDSCSLMAWLLVQHKGTFSSRHTTYRKCNNFSGNTQTIGAKWTKYFAESWRSYLQVAETSLSHFTMIANP